MSLMESWIRFEEENGTLDDYDLAVKKVFFCFACLLGFSGCKLDFFHANIKLNWLGVPCMVLQHVSDCFFSLSSTHESLILVHLIKRSNT